MMVRHSIHNNLEIMYLLDVISRNTSLRRVASTHGGEYAGPCPFCGGRDRFRVWPDSDRPGYWCRGCGRHGDAMRYLHDHDGLSFHEAYYYLTKGNHQSLERRRHFISTPASVSSSGDEPNPFWQDAARILCRHAKRLLWSPQGAPALDYLRHRGLSDQTIHNAALGYNPQAYYDAPDLWGFARSDRHVWVPAGIMIPWVVNSSIWCVRLRSCSNDATFRY